MTQSMKFAHGNCAFDLTEIFNDNMVRVQFWVASGQTYGYVDLDEWHLRELRRWTTVQIRKMKPKKINKTK